ncbi:hypothetical protein A2625_01060 [candidate division WOR-1 bacterium RIFCSPHIGHO2_01_FULL_53_15]|uniref:Nucleotidyl transferase AbiEii/AbiGii toxin family protein n=1 Tax=candidate division WOR-1 bacterium RIFCSPHIGHO2_01_FULL_53_15 TaxID=1802564 RepID=A0A1F4Q0U0_UNCSA|nr:MAG: hypothetical protein A2625_01060 [candidate division WOR-1 bacterium RIFCSPHIGHO2_01_FULL_53_15]OGC10737.1 MAG: hypothetical protein A3D23_04570 [candidate division WOR-1 bacterium RIFCSPHIGHO2_02_FULL_53_26]
MSINEAIRAAQLKLLDSLAGTAKTFALAGGTALELYYLKHRFSRDLDLLSPEYGAAEIENIIKAFEGALSARFTLESEFTAQNRASVRFYTAQVQGSAEPLKIDFVEDVLSPRPKLRHFNGVPVYDAAAIYFQKIVTLTGAQLRTDEIGRESPAGRNEPRDIFDIYYLSKMISPLHKFLKGLSRQYQRGMIQWYRGYSRQEMKLGVLDLDIYDKDFNAAEMISHIVREVKIFISETIDEL